MHEQMSNDGRAPTKREQREAVRRSIVLGSRLSQPYLVMNGLATAVASYGLLADSTAVVIGAMIIAMLMGPIMGLALALVNGDNRLLKNAVFAEVIGVALVMAIGALIGRIHYAIPVTSEILVRTKPNLLDLAIALFGGAAGAYATASPRVGSGLVGVAISTALVPPLAACGICLSRGLPMQAAGAFVLFLTNLVAIQCSASLVLYLSGFRHEQTSPANSTGYVRRLVIDGVALLGLAIFLYVRLSAAVEAQHFERNIKALLTRELREIPGSYLAEVRFVDRPSDFVVIAVVRVPNSITPAQTARIQAGLGLRHGKPITLHVRSTLTKETTAEGYLHEVDPTAMPEEVPDEATESQLPVFDEPESTTPAAEQVR